MYVMGVCVCVCVCVCGCVCGCVCVCVWARGGDVVAHRGNTFATLASTVGPVLTADWLDAYHSWPLLFSGIGCVFFGSALLYACMGGVSRLDQPPGVTSADRRRHQSPTSAV
jgi:hypothetical protein